MQNIHNFHALVFVVTSLKRHFSTSVILWLKIIFGSICFKKHLLSQVSFWVYFRSSRLRMFYKFYNIHRKTTALEALINKSFNKPPF